MGLTPDLVKKHLRRLVEAKTTVKGHTRRSKKGKAFNVVQYEREISAAAKAAGFNQNTIKKFNNLMIRNANDFKAEMESARDKEATPDEREEAREMADMYKSDMRDFQKIFDFAKAGRFNDAADAMDDMDTSAFEDISRVLGAVVRRGQRIEDRDYGSKD